VKYAWITKHHADINISLACNLLGISRTQYYTWLSNGDRRNLKQQELDLLISQIKTEYELSEKTYGSCNITKRVKTNNVKVCHNKVANIMQREGIKSRVCRKHKVCTTDSNHKLPIYENKLNPGFTAPRPNHSWCGDITFCATGQGWLYLATVIDLYSNKVVGYAMSNKIDKWLVVKALSNALRASGSPSGVIMHTDRGSVYCSKLYRNLIQANNLIGSMSRRGNCWDNSVAENFFGLIKKEFLNHYKFETQASAKLGIFNYINGWYNPHRIYSKIGYLSPDEYEEKNLGLIKSEIITKFKKYPTMLQNLVNQPGSMS
jgi:transposase InsO family protein